MFFSLKTLHSQLSTLKCFKDNKLISTSYFNLDLKFMSHDIENKMTLIDSVIKKLHFEKTFEKITLQKITNVNVSTNFMEISLKDMNDFQKIMLQDQLRQIGVKMETSPVIQVPWFPINYSDVNLLGKTLFQEQQLFNQDHPQFTDPVYRKRRDQIASIAINYRIQDQIPNVNYTKQENQLWRLILKSLRPLHKQHFCERFKYQLQRLNDQFNIENKIPQLSELSQYLNEQSGWRIKPVQGIISQRQFLNALAFKVFLSTQYLRHHATPFYTPEPDIVHQIIGHILMFADKDIAELSQKIGLISLGASDQQIKKLGAIYFFTIQFGVCKQNGQKKAYGAGFASCIKEIQHMASDSAIFKKFQPTKDCINSFTTQQLQSVYYVTESFEQALKDIKSYGDKVDKPFKTWYNQKTKSIEYDRRIQTFIIDESTQKMENQPFQKLSLNV